MVKTAIRCTLPVVSMKYAPLFLSNDRFLASFLHFLQAIRWILLVGGYKGDFIKGYVAVGDGRMLLNLYVGK